MNLRALTLGLTISLLLWALILTAISHAHVVGCHSRKCDRRIHAQRRTHWAHSHPWQHRYNSLSATDRAWAHCIAYWETFGTPWPQKARVVGMGGHRGAVQFDPRTAVAAGFTREVTDTTLYEQLVRAVWWRNRSSASQWSTSWHCR